MTGLTPNSLLTMSPTPKAAIESPNKNTTSLFCVCASSTELPLVLPCEICLPTRKIFGEASKFTVIKELCDYIAPHIKQNLSLLPQFPYQNKNSYHERNKTMCLGRRSGTFYLFYLAENMLGTQDA